MIDAGVQDGRKETALSNTQLYFAIGIPCLTIIVSVVINFLSLSNISGRVDAIQSQISGVRDDIREIRSDLKNIVGALNQLDKRVSLIEDRILGGAR